MMVGARNRHMLKIAVILGLILLGLYVLFSWRRDSQAQADRLTAANIEYLELRKNFNKLTDELKLSVQKTATLRQDIEKKEKTHATAITNKEMQIKECVAKTREAQTALQNAEAERDSYQDDNHRLKREKESKAAELEEVSDELNKLKLISSEQGKERTQCKSALEGVRSQLITAQTEGLGLSQNLQDCQSQLSKAQEAFGVCDVRVRNIQQENEQLHSQVLLLQQQNKALSSKQYVGLTENKNNGGAQHAQSDMLSISDTQKQTVLAQIQAKIARGKDLNEQEKYAYQILTKSTPGVNRGFDQLPRQQIPSQVPQGLDQIHVQPKVNDKPVQVNEPVVKVEKQLPPPQHKDGMEQAVDNHDPVQDGRVQDQEEIHDLVENKEHKEGDLDEMRNEQGDEFEGGADGRKDKEEFPDDYKDEKTKENGEHDDPPLPNPVKNAQEDEEEGDDEEENDRNEDNYDELHEDGAKQFERDQNRYKVERAKLNQARQDALK